MGYESAKLLSYRSFTLPIKGVDNEDANLYNSYSFVLNAAV